MSVEIINKFVELCFAGLSEKYSPRLSLLYEADDATFFAVSRVIDLVNNRLEIKNESIFVIPGSGCWQGQIYLLKNLIYTSDQKIKFYEDDYHFWFTPDRLIIGYTIAGTRGGREHHIVPRDKWRLLQLFLQVIKLPLGPEPGEIRQALVGERISLLNFSSSQAAFIPAQKNSDGAILIPSENIVAVLRKAKQEAAAKFYEIREGYVSLSSGSFKIY